MKATKQYFPVVLFITLYIQCGSDLWVWRWNVTIQIKATEHWAVLSCGAVYYVVQGGLHFSICRWNPKEG